MKKKNCAKIFIKNSHYEKLNCSVLDGIPFFPLLQLLQGCQFNLLFWVRGGGKVMIDSISGSWLINTWDFQFENFVSRKTPDNLNIFNNQHNKMPRRISPALISLPLIPSLFVLFILLVDNAHYQRKLQFQMMTHSRLLVLVHVKKFLFDGAFLSSFHPLIIYKRKSKKCVGKSA